MIHKLRLSIHSIRTKVKALCKIKKNECVSVVAEAWR